MDIDNIRIYCSEDWLQAFVSIDSTRSSPVDAYVMNINKETCLMIANMLFISEPNSIIFNKQMHVEDYCGDHYISICITLIFVRQ